MTAFTARSVVSAATLRGKPGVLLATRVTRPGGITVAFGPPDTTDPTEGDLSDPAVPDPDIGVPNGV